ncbi:MAG: K(+)-stimulated pyrophosphate-energized sodium pump, partial [Streptomycetaceae bacterium]|nr:K(+)-stimulated pyrophosphate-energized sodium pump [Streptomycetaceae bacterium]
MAGPLTPHTQDFARNLAASPVLTDGNRNLVLVIAVVALAALALAAVLVRQVLAADEGTDKMKEIFRTCNQVRMLHTLPQWNTLAARPPAGPSQSSAAPRRGCGWPRSSVLAPSSRRGSPSVWARGTAPRVV